MGLAMDEGVPDAELRARAREGLARLATLMEISQRAGRRGLWDAVVAAIRHAWAASRRPPRVHKYDGSDNSQGGRHRAGEGCREGPCGGGQPITAPSAADRAHRRDRGSRGHLQAAAQLGGLGCPLRRLGPRERPRRTRRPRSGRGRPRCGHRSPAGFRPLHLLPRLTLDAEHTPRAALRQPAPHPRAQPSRPTGLS